MHTANNCTSVLEEHDPPFDAINYRGEKCLSFREESWRLKLGLKTRCLERGGRYVVVNHQSLIPTCILLHFMLETRAQRGTVFMEGDLLLK